jgi:hypothetical protein
VTNESGNSRANVIPAERERLKHVRTVPNDTTADKRELEGEASRRESNMACMGTNPQLAFDFRRTVYPYPFGQYRAIASRPATG